MGILFSMPGGAVGETAYNTMTLTTGVGQAQAWNTSPTLNGVAGDVTFTVTTTNNVFATKSGLDFTTALALRTSGWIDASEMTFTGNALFGVCVVSLPSSLVDKIRIGVAYQYTLTGDVHRLLFQKVDDGAAGGANNSAIITPGPHKFDFVMTKATSAVANDGSTEYFIDDVSIGTRTGLDIYDDFAALEWLQIGNAGKISGLDATATGPFHIGKIAINDTGDPITFPPDSGRPYDLDQLTDLTTIRM